MLDRFMRWLWPERYSVTAVCVACGESERSKERMFHDSMYGWFCSEEEFQNYWKSHQI